MQKKWDKKSIFVHRGPTESKNSDVLLGFVNLFKILQNCKAGDIFVFHSQSSLPYLMAAFLQRLFLSKFVNFLYDVHDLHELSTSTSIFSQENFRYLVLGLFEFFVFQISSIRKITVSNGLSIEMAKRYKCDRPNVVYNISSNEVYQRRSNKSALKRPIVFFGTAERVPISLLPILESSGLGLHVYGRGITTEWLLSMANINDANNISTFGEYDPNNMSFLESYDFLVIYAPGNTSLNFRYSMPNKLFQALAAGLTVLVSDNFHEMLSLFSDITPAVVSISDIDLITIVEDSALKRDDEFFYAIKNRLYILHEESKLSYCQALNYGV